MKKKILSATICLIIVFTLFTVFGVSVNAAGNEVTKTGVMKDTSTANGGTIYWSYTYNTYTRKASLKITGNGYMPNGTDQDWFQVQQNAGCYIYSVTIGEGVKSIMSNAFAGEIYLEEVTLPSTIERIGESAFANTAIKKFNIPKKVNYVDGSMFAGSPITQFTVDSQNPYYKSYGGNVYSKDMSVLVIAAPGKFLTSGYKFIFPKSVTEIGESAFYGTAIESVTIPSNVKNIGKMAFAGCSLLSEVIIQNGVERIYDNVFLSCDSLTELHLPQSVNYIGYCTIGYRYDVAFDALADVLDSAGISYVTLNMSNYEYYSVLAGYGANAFSYCYADKSFELYAPKDSAGEKYAKNNGLKYVKSSYLISAVNSYTGVTLTWSYSDEVMWYNLYRKNSNGAWEFVANIDGAKTKYIDTAPYKNSDNTYALEVVYYTDSEYMDTSGITVHYVPSPVLTSIGNTVEGVRINWKVQEGAKYQYIYRKAPGETAWQYVCCISGTSTYYVDKNVKNNQKYTYTVRGYDGVTKSSWHPQGLSYTFVENPSFRMINRPENVTVIWTPAGKANFYNVYRKTGNGGWVLLGRASGDKTYYQDTTTVRGTTYRYTVRASYNGCLSGYHYQGTEYKSLEAPTNLKAENRISGVMVSWKKSIGAVGYNIYRRVPGGSWSRIAVVKGADTLSYLDTKAVSSKNYEYTVIGYSGSYLSGFDDDGVAVKFLSSPKIYSAVSTKNGISVKFNAVNGSNGYYVYRRTVNGSWSFVGKTTSRTATTFTDKTAKKGQTYVYTVRAYSGGYISSFYHNGINVKDIY